MGTNLRMKPDSRSKRWVEAEERCGEAVKRREDPAPEDLAIVAEEQLKWDEAHPDG